MTNIYNSQLKYTEQAVPISYLATQDARKLYYNIPGFQRNANVWPLYMKQRLINTILSNGFMPGLVFYIDPIDNSIMRILDGLQKITTIYEFLDGKFKTGGIRRGLPGSDFIEPNRYFASLSSDAQTRFRMFRVSYSIIQETDEARLMEVFVNLQNLTKLTCAEVLYATESKGKDAAQSLSEHPYFGTFYTTENQRRQFYQMCLYPLTIHCCGGLTHLDKQKIGSVAQGERDELITPALIETIEDNLFHISHLFDGGKKIGTGLTSIILHYQAVYLLRMAGYDLNKSRAGCLTQWFFEIDRYRKSHAYSTSAQIQHFAFQMTFWARELAAIHATINGLYTPDPVHTAAQIDRLTNWMRRRQLCPACNRSVSLAQIDRHAFRISDVCQSTEISRPSLMVV